MKTGQMLVPTSVPAHLAEEDGVVYPRRLVERPESLPPRFAEPLRAPNTPPWHTLVIGLETGRFGTRARFEKALSHANGKERSRLCHALSACYCGMFGFRRGGPGQGEFLAWASGLGVEFERRPVQPTAQTSALEARIVGRGCRSVAFAPETGHVPVGHALLLYQLAEVAAPLLEARFDETPHFDPDAGPSHDEPLPYTLHAWTDGCCFETAAHARGDFYDVVSSIGLLNGMLKRFGSDVRFVEVGGDGPLVCCGPLGAIVGLAAELSDELSDEP